MGSRNPDRISLSELRPAFETVETMAKAGWRLRSRCDTCRLELEIDWRVVIMVLGPRYSLWNRKARCRKVMCRGQVIFLARHHPRAHFDTLTAPDNPVRRPTFFERAHGHKPGEAPPK
jgi:hypothetical protein